MKIQWEYDLVERPFCEQLKAMGWQWIEGDKDVPDFTERANFREVLLKTRLATALKKLNLRDGQPWLDEDRIRRIIAKLEKAEGHRLMEVNESATRLLLKGTEIDGLPDWNFGRNQPVWFIDFENPANNNFLVGRMLDRAHDHCRDRTISDRHTICSKLGGFTAYDNGGFRTNEKRWQHDPAPAAGPFAAQVHPGRRSRRRGFYDHPAARVGRGGICRSQREDYRGLHRLRHAGNSGNAENAHDAGGADCRRLRPGQRPP